MTVKKRSGLSSEKRVRRVPAGKASPIHCLAVEFDDVAVGLEDEDLRVARDRGGTELQLSKVEAGNIVAEALAVEPCVRFAIAHHPQCKMNVVGVIRLVAAERPIRADVDVELLPFDGRYLSNLSKLR
jgi:hypothetical protein